MSELHADLRVGLPVDEIDDARPGGLVLGSVEARAAWRDPALGRHTRHLGDDEPCPAFGALGIVHQVPVGRGAVDGAILIHRRHDDAILEAQVTEAERREHRRARVPWVLSSRPLLPTHLRALQAGLVARAPNLLADTLPARERPGS